MSDRDRSIQDALSIKSPKLTEQQSEAVEKIMELWETLPPASQQELAVFFVRKLPIA